MVQNFDKCIDGFLEAHQVRRQTCSVADDASISHCLEKVVICGLQNLQMWSLQSELNAPSESGSSVPSHIIVERLEILADKRSKHNT